MKRIILLCFLIVLISACSKDTEYINREIHSENYIKTINSYLFNEDDGSVIEVNSQFEEQSNLMTNAVKVNIPEASAFYSDKHSCEDQEDNLFYCNLLLSQLLNKSVFSSGELQPKSFFEIYFLFHTLKEVGEMEDLQTLEQSVPSIPIPPQTDKIEYYYYLIMDYILNQNVHEEVKDELIAFIQGYKNNYLIEYDEPIILHAALILSRLYELEVDIEPIKDIYQDEINQISILLRDEITFWIHLEVMDEINKQSDEKVKMKILEKQPAFDTYYYSLDSLRNLYMMSAIFTSDDIEEYELYIDLIHHRLNSILNEKGDEIKASYQLSYYLQQTGLSIGFKDIDRYLIVGDQTCQNVSPFAEKYYCHKFMGSVSEELALNSDDDLLAKVTKYDIAEENDANKQAIKELYDEVLSFSEEEFYIILNTYVSLLLANDIDFNKEEIIDKISSYECGIGYCTDRGNYDFEMGVYFNNILNLLEGDENAQGFR